MKSTRRTSPYKHAVGRHRSQDKSEEEMLLEAKAKGHLEKPGKEQHERPGESFSRKNRGHQKGFGKNQGKEASDLSTPHGTRAQGSEHG